jgi:hypothetical protein
MDAALMPFCVACTRCGDMLAYEVPPRPPDFCAVVACGQCGWRGRVTLPRVKVSLIDTPFGDA